jgi:Protein of unknown function (DUF1553)/Protein of unknown function (DUF1549)/Planctomycete cytochrome C
MKLTKFVLCCLLGVYAAVLLPAIPLVAAEADEAFFQAKIEPLLIERCFKCHSHAGEIKGGLSLDSRSGWEQGGDGGPALVPGAPEKSRLIAAISFTDPDLQMPPAGKLADEEIALLFDWVRRGAPDPRPAVDEAAKTAGRDWESIYQERLAWWSLQPVSKPAPPVVKDSHWPRGEIDAFILGALEAKGLQPAPEANRWVLGRRLSFALTGLPPDPEIVNRFASDTSEGAYETFVQSLLDNPHFGEHWARHWMDVVHYSDTHGYEWDTPAKNAWVYRDYLVRLLNADVPFKQLIMEQIAGDLIDPRVDPATGLNESLIGPMGMRLGERQHGDNADFEGITQEAMTNMIDTLSKGFLGTTVACAQCHDHKLDAVAQKDFYALAGILMSSRWGVRSIDAVDSNLVVIEQLRQIKRRIRDELARQWLSSKDSLVAKIQAIPAAAPNTTFPETLADFWTRWQQSPITAAEFNAQRERRIAENQANLKLLADFTHEDAAGGFQWDGFGMRHGLARDGEVVVADEGDGVLAQILPAGRWSHVWSSRLAGAVRSPLLDRTPPPTISVGFAGGQLAAQSLIVDHALHSERMKFLSQPTPGWLTVTAGGFSALDGRADNMPRRVYLELVTKALNNYFPPRSTYAGMKEAETADPRSWFGVTKVYEHPAGKGPQDELTRFAPLLAGDSAPTAAELPDKMADLVLAAVIRWSQDNCDSEDVRLLNEALAAKWLPNECAINLPLATLVDSYRQTEQRLEPDRTVGSLSDWNEGRNERINVRGAYTDLGDEVPRGNIRFFDGATPRALVQASGRLEFAQSVANDRNPLTARVFVNRVWLHLFGQGLVRTPDDFGHLGEPPVHAELLDYLAAKFVEEGWSLKKLATIMVTSATWRQSSRASEAALTVDAENRLWHHLPMRRLEAEAIRDSMLSVTGRLDGRLGGPPIDPNRVAEDAAKRLFSGPLDGDGRRSIYLKMTLMEPPRFLALFNQPIPKLTAGRRDTTNVPDQALALLNDPLVIAMARLWSERVVRDEIATPDERAQQMFVAAFARPPTSEETTRLVKLAQRSAELRGADAEMLMRCQAAWQDVAHAIFNLKEFIYVQ